MAIQLPRASASTVGTGGRRKRARLPDAGDVGRVQVASDPGVQVPNFSQFAGGLEDAGAAVGDVADVLQARQDRLDAADAKAKNRSDTIESMRINDEIGQGLNDLLIKTRTEQDLSDENVLRATNQTARELVEKAVGDAVSLSPDAQLELMGDLEVLRSRFVTDAGKEHLNLLNVRLNSIADQQINKGRLTVALNPALVDQELNRLRAFFEKRRNAFPEVTADAYIRRADAEFTVASIETLSSRGQPQAARNLLVERASSLNPTQQDRALNAIDEIARDGRARILTPVEIEGLGVNLPSNAIVVQKGNGDFSISFPPASNQTDQQRRVESFKNQIKAQNPNMSDEDAEARAVNLAAGKDRIDINPTDGVVRHVDAVGQVVTEIQVTPNAPLPETAVPGETLFQGAESGAIAGIVPFIQEISGRTLGQLPGAVGRAFTPEDVIRIRQELRGAQNELIRALSINPRFPVKEIERIKDENDIEPGVFDSTDALLARMRGIDNNLRRRLRTERAAAANVQLPSETRGNASQAAKDIENFLNLLAVPRDDQDDSVTGDGAPTATNPATGEKLIFRNGQWETLE